MGSEDWDIVVLQGHSKGPISEGTAEPFRRAARSDAADIREDTAQPVFFMTWAYTSKPELQLVMDDDKHPTLAGTYLVVCMFFAALHGQTPIGVDYSAGLPDDEARFLQEIAWESWQTYSAD